MFLEGDAKEILLIILMKILPFHILWPDANHEESMWSWWYPNNVTNKPILIWEELLLYISVVSIYTVYGFKIRLKVFPPLLVFFLMPGLEYSLHSTYSTQLYLSMTVCSAVVQMLNYLGGCVRTVKLALKGGNLFNKFKKNCAWLYDYIWNGKLLI